MPRIKRVEVILRKPSLFLAPGIRVILIGDQISGRQHADPRKAGLKQILQFNRVPNIEQTKGLAICQQPRDDSEYPELYPIRPPVPDIKQKYGDAGQHRPGHVPGQDREHANQNGFQNPHQAAVADRQDQKANRKREEHIDRPRVHPANCMPEIVDGLGQDREQNETQRVAFSGTGPVIPLDQKPAHHRRRQKTRVDQDPK